MWQEQSELSELSTPERDFILQSSCSFCKHTEAAGHGQKPHSSYYSVFYKAAGVECMWSFQSHGFGRALWPQEDDHYYICCCYHANVGLYETEVPMQVFYSHNGTVK